MGYVRSTIVFIGKKTHISGPRELKPLFKGQLRYKAHGKGVICTAGLRKASEVAVLVQSYKGQSKSCGHT